MDKQNKVESAGAAEASVGNKRKKLLAAVLGAFALAGAGYGTYWGLNARHYESTDDAYVDGNVVQITPEVAGTVISIGGDTTDVVKAGQTLVELDPADAHVALDQAEAQLAKTVRQVRNLFATTAQLQADVRVREVDLAKAQEDVVRRERLTSSGAIATEEMRHALDNLKSAQATLIAAKEQAAANQALVDETTVENHPDVRNAAAKVRDAYLAYERTRLPAPVSGLITKRSVQLGQRVNPGTPLMAVVPLDQVWVNANFKESQLKYVQIGQPVKLSADFYGSKVEYNGRLVGLDAGTGSAFSLLPAQNATGNWIKVVQRLPVRIAIEPEQLAKHPLRIGLSMQVTVDVREQDGLVLPRVVPGKPVYATQVFDREQREAGDLIAEIVRANGGNVNVTRLATSGAKERQTASSEARRQPHDGARVVPTAATM